ncbi:MAG: hypothetical protein JJE12_02735 [Anaerolineales bacterium]|nr:hypothetical protein [Anaerolineales bacterium]
MLQSRQVGDAALVKTLIREQYSHVFRFVSSIIDAKSLNRCGEITEQIITAAVGNSASYQGEMSVNAWLSRQSIAILRMRGESPRKQTHKNMIIPGGPGRDDISREILNWYAGLTCERRVIITLFYLFNFSSNQISCVIDVGEHLVNNWLEESKGYFLEIGAGPRHRSITGSDIQRTLAEFWPGVELDRRDEIIISQRVLDDLQAKDRRKRQIVTFGESFLAILAIIFVISLGGLIGRFTPKPTPEIVYETRIVNQIVFVSPTPGPTQIPTPFPEKAIIYEAVGGETLFDVAEKINFDAQILSALNNIPTDQPLKAGQKIMIGISESRVIMPTLNPPRSTPAAHRPALVSLSMDSDETIIQQRIADSKNNWQTLWADALVIQYGPPGYIGEPEFKRQQIWIDQPYFHYLLDGDNGGAVEYAYSVVGGWENLLNIQTGELLSNVGPQEFNFQPELKQMLFSSDFEDGFTGEIELIGQDMVAGRKVLVLARYLERDIRSGNGSESQAEKVLQGRYWVDKNLGTILRVQKFTGTSNNQLFKEAIVSKLIFNVSIPRRLYDRSQYLQTYFAKDHEGDYVHDPIEIPADFVLPRQILGNNLNQSPPPDFVVGDSQLDFQWTSLGRFSPEQGTRVDLIADGYFVGNIEFAEPEQLICSRSPDGVKIAFSSWSSESNFGFTPLVWFDLNQLPEVMHFDPRLVPYDFAFSNDSQQLAVYACERVGDQTCGLYIVEVGSGESRLLRAVEQGSGLIWSPDGEAIAIQGSFLKGGKWRLLVLDIHSGNTIDDGPFDWEGLWVAHDSPLHEWGVQYPPLRGGLELCRLSPQGD